MRRHSSGWTRRRSIARCSPEPQLGLTGVGRGVALPHARIDGIEALFGIFVRLSRRLDFEAIDDEPVDLVFLLLIPSDAGNEHVAALAAIARRLRDANLVHCVRDAASAAAVRQLLTDT